MPDAVTLVVFCRRPAPGVGKQRLARAIGERAAFEVAQALLDCALEDASGWPGPVVLSPADAADAAWAAALLGDAASVQPQPDGNLGERMNAVDRALRRAGHAAQLFTGTDLPALVPGDFAAAREALARDDVVLSPADDGGVTLMGARVPWPEFADLPWSTPALGAALERRCREQGLSVRHLAPTWDVDELADLERVRRDLGADPRPARRRLRDRVARVLAASSVA